MRRTSASWASARASATRWRMPPDSSCGRLPPKLAQVHELEQLLRAWPAFVPCRPRRASAASSTLPRAREPREERGFLEHQRRVRVADVDASPASGWSSPATMFSSVLLPQPDAPSRQTNSPFATSSETSSSAWVASPACPKTFETWSRTIAGRAADLGGGDRRGRLGRVRRGRRRGHVFAAGSVGSPAAFRSLVEECEIVDALRAVGSREARALSRPCCPSPATTRSGRS